MHQNQDNPNKLAFFFILLKGKRKKEKSKLMCSLCSPKLGKVFFFFFEEPPCIPTFSSSIKGKCLQDLIQLSRKEILEASAPDSGVSLDTHY